MTRGSFTEAVRATQGGVVIDFDVSPGAKIAEVPSGYNPWRKRIEAKIRAPPEKGKANDELIDALSRLFHVPAASIQITSGATGGKKTVLILGITAADAAGILEGRLGG